MTRRVPVFATLVVLAAVATMIALGFWQLGRLAEKEALIARYAAARDQGSIPLPVGQADRAANLYRPAVAICDKVLSQSMSGGRNRLGAIGWVQSARCLDPDGVAFDVAFGWSERPETVVFAGGPVNGIIAGSQKATRLVASGAPDGMMTVPPPDPREVPNNHLSYAVQWFLFAATALIIYALALRKRWRASAA